MASCLTTGGVGRDSQLPVTKADSPKSSGGRGDTLGGDSMGMKKEGEGGGTSGA